MFDLFDVNMDGRTDAFDFMIMDTLLFSSEDEISSGSFDYEDEDEDTTEDE